ncbi:gastrula zinc finger protein XlCGF17.1-like [Periplaneta americana]|uniref:gastrula zinc finger protein XlCGF17.1-like n=1 Tax=Periplaneta americana TaxID=6978 RepID=UPI0037E8932F
MMDAIKMEPEVDPLDLQSGGDVNIEEAIDPQMENRALESTDHSHGLKWEVETEEIPKSSTLPVVKSESVEEPFAVVTVKEEIKEEIITEEHEDLSQSTLNSDESESTQMKYIIPDPCVPSENLACDSELDSHTHDQLVKRNSQLQTQSREQKRNSYKCNNCGKLLATRSTLRMHFRTHYGERKFECDDCGRSFLFLGSLLKHIRTHTGEKPFRCDICGNTFSQSGTLKDHVRTHTGEKPFNCDICGRGFTKSGNLISHVRTHTGEKPFKCDICGKCFSESGTVKVHLRTHTREKPFKCITCEKSFSHLGSLKYHARTHNGAVDLDAE